jgi:hypothetical protein
MREPVMGRKVGQLAGRGGRDDAPGRRALRPLIGVGVVLGIGVAVVMAGVPGGLMPTPSATDSPRAGRSPGPTASPAMAGGGRFEYHLFDQSGVAVRVPSGWQLVAQASARLIRLAGDDPAGSLSIAHADDGVATLCDPGCVPIELRSYLPFHLDRTLDEAEDAVSELVGADDWRPASGLSPRLEGARRLDIPEGEGRPARTYVVAAYLTEVILIAGTVEGGDHEGILASILGSVRTMPLPGSKTGAEVPVSDPAIGVELRIPDVWGRDPVIQGLNVRQFGDGRVTVSVVDEQGILSVCEPTCRPVLLRDLVSEGAALDLRSIEAAVFRPSGSGTTVGDTVLAGAPARFQHEATTIAGSYRALALVDGAAVFVWIDLDRDDLDVSVAQAVVASLDYADPGSGVRMDDRIVGDGFELLLPSYWQGSWNPSRQGGIGVVSGDGRGRFWLCRWSGFNSTAIPCSIVQATTLQELARNIGFTGKRIGTVIDGEPAIVVRVEAYEYPARSGQYLAYVLAVHDGRPFVIRMLNRRTATFHLDEVLAGFRFTD